MQPGMQAWVGSPPRDRLRSRICSPPSLKVSFSLSTCWPEEKLRVGSPPIVLVKSPTMAVPRLRSALIAASASSILL